MWIDLGKTAVGETALAPDGKTLAVAAISREARDRQGRAVVDTTADRSVRRWDPATGVEIRPQPGHRATIGDAAFTSDGRSLVTGPSNRGSRRRA
jgi:hypothetical protein